MGQDDRSLAKNAFRFVLIIGIANLFADFTYESARSINGQYLASLGAASAAVGFTAGFGELVGYGLRSFVGLITDRTRRYWLATILGYTINLLAVPALALAGNWPVAAALIVCERTGRAIRKPPTEAMLSYAGTQMGQGWVFGLNEALDQAGATLGPLMMALVLFLKGGYRTGYMLLLFSALLAIATVLVARYFFPPPRDVEAERSAEPRGFSRDFWWYMVAAGCIAAGFADFALIGYHLEKTATMPSNLIPIYYAVAMGVGAIGALVLGRLFDSQGIITVIGAFFLSAFFAPLVFLGSARLALLGMVLWGLGMAAQESLLKSLVAGIVGASKRSTAFGLFDTGFGVAWFLGSWLMGYLYSVSLPGLVIFSVAMQLLALPIFMKTGWRRRAGA